jgi:hypothetical protein
MKKWIIIVCGVVCLGIYSQAHAASFQVTSSIELQFALLLAQGNGQDDTINIAAGDYHILPTGPFSYVPIENKRLDMIGAGIEDTILDGDGLSQIFKIDTTGLAADSDADIRFQGVSFRNGSSSSFGAGLSTLTNDADIRIEDCDFQSNETTVALLGEGGGGFFAFASNFGSVFVTHSQFSKNSSPQSAGAGAFITAEQGDVVLEGNTYVDNSAIPPGSSSETFGGGAVLVAFNGDLIVNGNIFLNNFAGSGGGGLNAIVVNGTGLITNNIIARNLIFTSSSPSDPTKVGGGGLSLVVPLGSVVLTNNTITENRATGAPAGGIFVYEAVTDAAMVTASNNIIWGNSAAPGSLCATSCNDIRVNDDQDLDNKGASFSISHSDFSDISFQCTFPGCTPDQHVDVATNLDKNPIFLQASQDDFHLSDSSPLIDKGDPLAPGLPLEDFDGEARIQGVAPDMGAFESAARPAVSEDCGNKVDDDGNGQTDCEDVACAANPVCQNAGAGGGITGGGVGGGAGGGSGNSGGGCSLSETGPNAALLPWLAIVFTLLGIRGLKAAAIKKWSRHL